jgi:hypothetical protein
MTCNTRSARCPPLPSKATAVRRPVRNSLRRTSGLLPKDVLELGLDDDGVTAWCRYRDEDEPQILIEVDADDPEGALADDLMVEHRFAPLLALTAARQLYAEHRRRNTRH